MFAVTLTSNARKRVEITFSSTQMHAQVSLINSVKNIVDNAKSINKFSSISLVDEECYISEDDSESHCMKKIENKFPSFLYPGYKCNFGDTKAMCTFGPK